MKNTFRSVIAALALFAAPIGTSIALVGTVGCAQVEPGQSALVVRAEQTASVSFAVVEGFLKYEYTNRALLRSVNPEIKKAADAVRVEAPKAFSALSNAIKAYKGNRSEENKASLVTYLAVVDALTADSVKWFATAKTGTPVPPAPPGL